MQQQLQLVLLLWCGSLELVSATAWCQAPVCVCTENPLTSAASRDLTSCLELKSSFKDLAVVVVVVVVTVVVCCVKSLSCDCGFARLCPGTCISGFFQLRAAHQRRCYSTSAL